MSRTLPRAAYNGWMLAGSQAGCHSQQQRGSVGKLLSRLANELVVDVIFITSLLQQQAKLWWCLCLGGYDKHDKGDLVGRRLRRFIIELQWEIPGIGKKGSQ